MVTTPTRQRTGSAADRNKVPTAMQWEIFSEEGRPLLWSHMVSVGMGLTFLMLAVFGPKPIAIPGGLETKGPRIMVDVDRMWPESRDAAPVSSDAGRGGSSGGRAARSASSGHEKGGIAEVFRRAGINPGGMPGTGAGVLHGVQTSSGDGYSGLASLGSAGQSGKAALSYGEGVGPGSGRAGLGDGNGAAGGRIGGVSAGGGVTRSVVSVSAPRVIAEKLGAPGRDVSQLGTIVRDRQAVLQSCYTQEGLAVNPKLAGTVDVAITLNGAGSVARVDARPRSMSGPGTSQVMSCIEGKIGSWRFPASEAGSGTYSFPFSFTS